MASSNGGTGSSTPRVTRSNRTPPIWLGDDPLIHLRQWATDTTYPLPDPDATKLVVGTDSSVDLRLVDPTRSVSGRHARLVRKAKSWQLVDLQSRNGISLEGSRPQKAFLIAPGMEIGIGELTLVAENQTLVRLRRYLARVLGTGVAHWQEIDLAMRAIRNAAYRRNQLVLLGVEDVVSIARQIHVRTTPIDAPFIVCGKRLYNSDVNVRVTARFTDGSAALAAAAGGTVCVRHDKPPRGYDHLIEATLDPLGEVQMYICGKKAPAGTLLKTPIVVPTLSSRVPEIKSIVMEYALDAIHEFSSDSNSFMEHERDWIAENTSTFMDIEVATLRTVARNAFGSVQNAADRLGLPNSILRDWFIRRKGLAR